MAGGMGRPAPAKVWHAAQARALAWAGARAWQRRHPFGSVRQRWAEWHSEHAAWPARACRPARAIWRWHAPQARIGGEEVVAREAMELLHPARADEVLAVARAAARDHRLEPVHAGGVALHALDLLLHGVDAVTAGALDLRPLRIVREVAGGAGADLDLRVRLRAVGAPPGEEGAQHGEALLRGRVVTALARDGAVAALRPERELGAGAVAVSAEARVGVDVALEARRAVGAAHGQHGRGGEPDLEETSAANGSSILPDSSGAAKARRGGRPRDGAEALP